MAVYSAKLSVQDAAFPLLSRTNGRSALIPSLDVSPMNEAAPSGLASNASSVFNAVAKPHLVYAENILPRAHGFNSIGFLELYHCDIANAQNTYLLQIRNMSALSNVSEDCVITFFKDVQTVSYFNAHLDGTIVTTNAKADLISQGNVGGIQFLLLAYAAYPNNIQLGEVRINDANTAVELKHVYELSDGYIPAGMSAADFSEIKFMCGAGNYMILAKQDGTIYWNDPNMGQYIPVLDNATFTIGSTITGSISGATATYATPIGTVGFYTGASIIGDFQDGETLTSEGQSLTITAVAGFTAGELITGSTSGATGHYVAAYDSVTMHIGGEVSGTFVNEVITGEISGHTDTVTATGTFVPSTTVNGTIVDAPDFTPSDITGAGFKISSSMSGQCIGLQSLGDGFILHTTVGSIFGRYSQNTLDPWVLSPCWNSAPIHSSLINTMLTSTDSYLQYQQFVWGDSGLMQVSVLNNSVSIFPEVSDFIAGQMLEELSTSTMAGVPVIINPNINAGAIDMALARVDNRYLCISYGHFDSSITTQQVFTQCLVYDIALKRWGKLVVDHVAVIKLPDSFPGVADVHEIGIISPTGSILAVTEQIVSVVDSVTQTIEHTGVLIIAGINFVRGGASTINGVDVHFDILSSLPDPNAGDMELGYSGSKDAINLAPFKTIPAVSLGASTAKWSLLKTAAYHALKVKGNFKISHLEIEMFKAGVR